MVGWVRQLSVFALGLGLWAASPIHANPQRCEEIWQHLQSSEIQQVKVLLTYRVSHADNLAFSRIVDPSFTHPAKLFFHVENAVLKALNDIYFRDKELSAGTTSWYKKSLLEILRMFVSSEPVVTYADYKGIRQGYETDTPMLRKQLSGLYLAAGIRFADHMKGFPELHVLFEGDHGLISNPRSWFLAGIGTSPDRAALAARFARYESDKDGKSPPIMDFSDPALIAKIVARLLEAEQLRSGLAERLEKKQFAELPLVEDSGVNGKPVLSALVFEAIRKIQADSETKYIAQVRRKLGKRFRVLLTPEEVRMLQKYHHIVDTFSPSILEPSETVDIGMGNATHGLVAVDVSGQGNRNLFHTQIALTRLPPSETRTAKETAELAVLLTREEQQVASDKFNQVRTGFAHSVMAVFPETDPVADIFFSGDDGVFRPKRVLGVADKHALLKKLAASGTPSDFRVSFVPQTYADQTVEIPLPERVRLISQAETFEKSLREKLESEGADYWDLKKILLGVDVVPESSGHYRLNLFVGGEPDPSLAARLEKTAKTLLPSEARWGTLLLPPSSP